MNLANLIFIAVFLVALVFAVRGIVKKRRKGGCGCGCADCDANCNVKAKDKKTKSS